MKQAHCLVLLILTLLLLACADSGVEKRLTGKVTCPEDINPTHDAVVGLQLNEITVGVPNNLARQSIPWPGKCPIPSRFPTTPHR